MSWTNYSLDGYAKCVVQNPNGYTTYTDGMPVTATQLYYAVGNYGRTMTREQANAYPSGQKTYLYGDSTNGGILIDRTNTSYTRLKINYGDGTETTLCEIWDYNNGFGIFCGINEDTKKGTIYGVGNHGTYYYPIAILNSEKVYNVLNPAPPYNWQSVPSISGKNGILSLPVLIDTDGNPVSSGSASDFSAFPTEAKVRTLANANI